MTKELIGVVDYNAGNLKSVETALRHLGVDFFISRQPADFRAATRLIFPGVGDAGAAMAALQAAGLDALLQQSFAAGKPILGICLGTQIVFAHSAERDTPCLGLVPGNVVRFPVRKGYKIPHMGWNQVSYPRTHPLFAGIPAKTSFYFVHSYYPVPAESAWVIGETDYDFIFAAAICYKNLLAVQFHPEKSGEPGLKLLANFTGWQG